MRFFSLKTDWKLSFKLRRVLGVISTTGIAGFLLAGQLAVLSGCSGKQIDESDPAALYNDAEEELKSDHYQIAIDKFRVVKNKFPYSKYSVDAQLRIADVYFMEDSFAEAATAYESFRDLHPKHEKTAYAMFRIGKSYYNDIPSPISRDLTPAHRALAAYTDFLNKYPNAPEAAEARKDVVEIRRIMGEKELYIADFYFKRGYYRSSEERYKKVIELYPETEAANEARKKLTRIESEHLAEKQEMEPPPSVQPNSK
ncbi:MAG: hypothetical protein A2428_02555 [Bdellovibrionales bacterium RIFOXYC1_FULL_54_43]|nr:MAG: hypothetical protein A2428_02555 [Bdellovibrionales bacterium RIFOXYC1_FULL_54_43]OFZ80184.1 MAG: hypothetical protein A2603_11370 [Bdellovibrionales bacterium RIFOXYD1_FULL_55_31]